MKKIAVIDDDINMRKLIKSALENSDKSLAVITFYDNIELISILKENFFDVLIIDYMMPNIDGLELIMHYSDIYQKAPIILITAYPEVEQVEVLKENRHSLNITIMTKPFDIDLLTANVKNLLNHCSVTGSENS